MATAKQELGALGERLVVQHCALPQMQAVPHSADAASQFQMRGRDLRLLRLSRPGEGVDQPRRRDSTKTSARRRLGTAEAADGFGHLLPAVPGAGGARDSTILDPLSFGRLADAGLVP